MEYAPLRFMVDIEPTNGHFRLRCNRMGSYAWTGDTPLLALEAFAEDVTHLAHRFLERDT